MAWLTLIIVIAGSAAALVLLFSMSRPTPTVDRRSGASNADVARLAAGSPAARLALWARADTLHQQLRREIEGRADFLLGRVAEEIEAFKVDLEQRGVAEAEAAVKVVRSRAERHFLETWPWQRVSFDLAAYVESDLLPLLVGRYDAFRKDMGTRLVARLEAALGTSVASMALGDTGFGSRERNANPLGAIAVGGAGAGIAWLGVVGGAGAALPVAALAVAVATGFAVKNYKSKADLAAASVQRAERMARRIFHGEGFRDPVDGALIPSATYWLERSSTELATRASRRIELERDAQIRGLARRHADLRNRWESGHVQPAQLMDAAFLAAQLHPNSQEVTHA